jgi:hypothetical protein
MRTIPRGGKSLVAHVEHARCGRGASEKEKPRAETLRRALGDDAVMLRAQESRTSSLDTRPINVSIFAERESKGVFYLGCVGDPESQDEATGEDIGEPVMRL